MFFSKALSIVAVVATFGAAFSQAQVRNLTPTLISFDNIADSLSMVGIVSGMVTSLLAVSLVDIKARFSQ